MVSNGKGDLNDYIFIVDFLCNLDLLFYVAAQTGKTYLADTASTHATTLLTSHVRRESTYQRQGYGGTMYSTRLQCNFDLVERPGLGYLEVCTDLQMDR